MTVCPHTPPALVLTLCLVHDTGLGRFVALVRDTPTCDSASRLRAKWDFQRQSNPRCQQCCRAPWLSEPAPFVYSQFLLSDD